MRQIKAREQDGELGRRLGLITYREALERAVSIYNHSANRSLGGRTPAGINAGNVGEVLVEKEERRAAALDRFLRAAAARSGGSLRGVEAVLPSEARLAVGTRVRVLLAALAPSDPAADPTSRNSADNSFRKEYSRPTYSSQASTVPRQPPILFFLKLYRST